jgi:hypothetical protein
MLKILSSELIVAATPYGKPLPKQLGYTLAIEIATYAKHRY